MNYYARVLLFASIFLTAVGATWALNTKTKPHPPKAYTVTLTMDQWNSVFGGLEAVKNAVKTSSMSAKDATFISDSIITIYQIEFSRQIQQQKAAENIKPETKKDTTTKAKKN